MATQTPETLDITEQYADQSELRVSIINHFLKNQEFQFFGRFSAQKI
jgi:hypothetical protein